MGNKPIVHAPIATGSTEPRDIRDRFADWCNVKDFGAKGDDLTDDSNAFLAAQASGASAIMVPKGSYYITEDIPGIFYSFGEVEQTGTGSVTIINLLDDSNVVHKTGTETISGAKRFNNVGYIEMYGLSGSGNGGLIDFHSEGSTSDFDCRIACSGHKGLEVTITDNLYVNSGTAIDLISGSHIALSPANGIYVYNNMVFGNGASNSCQLTYNGSSNNFGCWNLAKSSWCWREAFDGIGHFYGQLHNESDEKFKTNIVKLPDSVLDAWDGVDFKQFRLKVNTEHLHAGVIAQQVINAFKSYNLDALDYNFIEYDEDAQGYLVCYEEALCIEAAYQRRRADRAEARIASLEERLAALEAKLEQ